MTEYDQAARYAVRRAVWSSILEGWTMERSPFLEEVEMRGHRRGQLQASRAHLVRLLQSRLGRPLPAELAEAIMGQDDLAVFDRWFDRALTVTSLDEARALLTGP